MGSDRTLLLKHPLNVVRIRATRGLELAASPEELVRGGWLDAVVTVSDAAKLEDLEVGLFCTESYEIESGTGQDRGPATAWATAYETWVPMATTPGVQTARLRVPPEAPFSYEGDILSFRWEVIARGRRKRRLDARVTHPVSVLP